MGDNKKPVESYTVKEVAAYLRCTERSVARMIRDGQLPAYKVANQWRVRNYDLWKLQQPKNIKHTKAQN